MTKKTIALLSMGTMMLAAAPSEAWRGWAGKEGTVGNAVGKEWRKRGEFRKRARGQRIKMMKAKLGLTDAQIQQIKAIRSDLRAKIATPRKQLQPLRKQMHSLMTADLFDAARIYAVRSQLRSLRQVITEERFKAKLQWMQLLTKEQRTKMMQLKKGKHRRGKFFRGSHGRFGRGFGGQAQL